MSAKPQVIDEPKTPETTPEPKAPVTQAALAVAPQGLIARPIVSPEEAKVILAEWEALKKAIGTEADIRREQRWSGKEQRNIEVAYYKKSYWRKAATFLGLSVEAQPSSERFEILADGLRLASVTYICKGPSGRTVSGDGHCATDEGGKAKWTAANLLGTAHTRAYNRAVSNYIGGGEVSAEEIDQAVADGKVDEFKAASLDLALKTKEALKRCKTTEELKDCWAAVTAIQESFTRYDLKMLEAVKDGCKAALQGGAA